MRVKSLGRQIWLPICLAQEFLFGGRTGRGRFFMSRQRWFNSSHSLTTAERLNGNPPSKYQLLRLCCCYSLQEAAARRLGPSVGHAKGLKGTHKHNGDGRTGGRAEGPAAAAASPLSPPRGSTPPRFHGRHPL